MGFEREHGARVEARSGEGSGWGDGGSEEEDGGSEEEDGGKAPASSSSAMKSMRGDSAGSRARVNEETYRVLYFWLCARGQA